MKASKDIKVIISGSNCDYHSSVLRKCDYKVTFRNYEYGTSTYGKLVERVAWFNRSGDTYVYLNGEMCRLYSTDGGERHTCYGSTILTHDEHLRIIDEIVAARNFDYGNITVIETYAIAYLGADEDKDRSATILAMAAKHLGIEDALREAAVEMAKAEQDKIGDAVSDDNGAAKLSLELRMVLGALALIDGAEDDYLNSLVAGYLGRCLLASKQCCERGETLGLNEVVYYATIHMLDEMLADTYDLIADGETEEDAYLVGTYKTIEEAEAEAHRLGIDGVIQMSHGEKRHIMVVYGREQEQEEQVVVLRNGGYLDTPHCLIVSRSQVEDTDTEMEREDLEDIAWWAWSQDGEVSDLDREAIACLAILSGWALPTDSMEEQVSIGIHNVIFEAESVTSSETIVMVDEDGEIVEDGGTLVDEDGNILDSEEQIAS